MEKTCNGCKAEDLSTITMSGAQFEAIEARHERREKRYVGLIALLIVLLIGSNLAWLIYENQFEDVVETYTVEQDGENGNNNSVINGGVIE